MKKLFISLLATVSCCFVNAQRVGIGIATPHPSAKLDITSSSGGLLLPRMTTANRIDIATPPAGLMVYDNTNDRFFFHNGTTWRTILDNTYWSLNGNYVYTANNVGIGTSSPSTALDVFGNARISGDMKITRSTGSQNKINFDYTGSNSNFLAQGLYFNIGGLNQSQLTFNHSDIIGESRFRLAFNNGTAATMRSSGELSFNSSSSATLQLQTAGTNKGFVQLSGDDLRTGINASNPTGQFIIRNNGDNKVFVTETGNVGIGRDAPSERLHVAGTIKASGNITAATIKSSSVEITGEVRKPGTTGSFDLVPLAYGFINADGTIRNATTNVSVVRISTGVYEISVAGIASSCTIIAQAGQILTAKYLSAGKCRVTIDSDADELTPESGKWDDDFYFIIFQP